MNLEWFLFELAGLLYLKASAVLLIGVVAAFVFRTHTASTRYWSWNLCLLLLVLIVPLSLALPEWDAPVLSPGYSSLPPVEDMEFAGGGLTAGPINDLLSSDLFRDNHELGRWELIWGLLLTIWIIGAVILMAKLLADLVSLALTSRRGTPAPDDWHALVEDCRRRSGCRLGVRVRICEAIGSPLVWGFIRPTILLPASASKWSRERLRMVLLHESLHAARFDHTMMVLAQVVRCLYWGNPLTWLAVHRHSIERELSCDERVVRCGNDRYQYAGELVAITRDLKRETRYASVAMTEQFGLKARVKSLVSDHLGLRLLHRGWARTLILGSLVFTFSLASARLVQPHDPDSVESLVADLFGLDISLADDAARRLGERGAAATAAVPYLIKTAHEVGTPHTRMQSIIALRKIGGERALKGLISLTRHAELWTRYTAIAQLEHFDDEQAIDRLRELWEEAPDPYAGLRAYRGLTVHDLAGDPGPFFDVLESGDEKLRSFAAGQLGEYCELEAVKYAIEKREWPADICVETLLRLFSKDPKVDVRKAAARSVARLAPDTLQTALPELDEDRRLLAEAALRELTR